MEWLQLKKILHYLIILRRIHLADLVTKILKCNEVELIGEYKKGKEKI